MLSHFFLRISPIRKNEKKNNLFFQGCDFNKKLKFPFNKLVKPKKFKGPIKFKKVFDHLKFDIKVLNNYIVMYRRDTGTGKKNSYE